MFAPETQRRRNRARTDVSPHAGSTRVFFDAGVNSPPISEHITCQGRWRGLDLWLERRFNPLFLTEEAQIIVTSSRDQSGSPLAGAFSGGLPG